MRCAEIPKSKITSTILEVCLEFDISDLAISLDGLDCLVTYEGFRPKELLPYSDLSQREGMELIRSAKYLNSSNNF